MGRAGSTKNVEGVEEKWKRGGGALKRILPGHGDTSPFQESHPDHSLAPNCSLIGPGAGVEEQAAALQAAAIRGGFKPIILNNPRPQQVKTPCPPQPRGSILRDTGHPQAAEPFMRIESSVRS